MTQSIDPELSRQAINTLRMLAVDAVEAANAGHPGMPMGAAPYAFTLWSRYLRFNPQDPQWPNRDRFILSAGHGSMLLYALLHLTGYDLPMEELKRFRRWDSKTPGHPEYGLTPGVETTTGPWARAFPMVWAWPSPPAWRPPVTTPPGTPSSTTISMPSSVTAT